MPGGFINGGFNIGRAVFPVPFGSFSGPLDGFDTSAFVLTTAVLFSRQIGQPMFRIRRSADDNHCDVLPDTRTLINGTYFVGLDSPVNNFETASAATTLGEFVASSGYSNPDSLAAASDWFCRTAYDSSGNGRDAEQTTAANQPQMGSAGALVTENGKPAIDFDEDSGHALEIQKSLNGEFSIFTVQKIDKTTVAVLGDTYLTSISANTFTIADLGTGQFGLRTSVADTTVASDIVNQFQSSFIGNGSGSISIYKNSVFGETETGNPTTFTENIFVGGDAGGEARTMDGRIQEAIIYDSDQSANRAAIEAKLAEIYGITLA